VRPSPARWDENGRPEHLKRAIDGSLKRLKLERIDLYQLHAPDPRVPFMDSVGALADAQRAGKIRHIGLSNVDVAQMDQARKLVKVASVQNEYNLGNRESERVLEHCEKLGIAFLPWYPLGAGAVLRSARVRNIAVKLKATPAQVAIAWLLAKSSVMLPIPGTASIAHLEENMRAAELRLGAEDVRALSS
jgi:pyridoxine 4-dehydrogenase